MRGGHNFGGRGGGKLILGYQHKVVVPKSTEKIIICSVNRIKGQFNTDFYDPAMTRRRLPREEITKFLQEINPIVKPIFNNRMNSFLKCFQAAYPFLLIGLVILFVITIILVISQRKFQVFFFTFAIFGAFFLSLMIISIINCFHCADIKRAIEESKEKVMPLVIARNPEFKVKGYYWVVPHQFPYWLELWVDDASQVVTMEQQYGIPVQEIPYYHPSNSNQISPITYSP